MVHARACSARGERGVHRRRLRMMRMMQSGRMGTAVACVAAMVATGAALGACAGSSPMARDIAVTASPPLVRPAVLDSLLAPFARPGMPGASVLVMRGDTVVWRESVGLADVETGVVATPATNYRLASLSKQFTATAILLLVRDGTLTLDARARDLLPTLPAYAREVTVRHLLTHTSGLWDYEAFVPDSQVRQVSDADALQLVSARAERLYFAPGSAWRYSNTGYALLALIVERVSGQRFADFLRMRVFLPLGMQDSYAHEEGRTVVPRRAWGHTVRAGEVWRTDQSNTSAVLGDGGIYSSIDDLARWHASLTRAPLVGEALWSLARTPHRLSDGSATEYGFGWFVDRHLGQLRLRHHGETRGFTNAVSRYPEAALTIVVLTNRTDAEPWSIADAIARTWFQGGSPPPATPRGATSSEGAAP